MSMLDRKLLRDLRRLWAQVTAIALVLACGVMTLILAVGSYRALDETRAVYYDRYLFANVFASAHRAPTELFKQLAAIDGVGGVDLRIYEYVLLDMPSMKVPATGLAVSLPEHGQPAVNQLYLRSGRLPEPDRVNEAAVLESFALAHRLREGSQFQAVMNGRKQTLTVTGIVLSPEFIYTIGPGEMVPDPKRFGVFYMSRKALEGMFDMAGAFNSLTMTTLRDASERDVLANVDGILNRYGGTGAYLRKNQISHSFLDTELVQLKGMAAIIPPIFLFVAAFLVNMILTRLIALEREQIGLLKALGYSEIAVAWHYCKLTIVIASMGIVIGFAAGSWLGRGLTRLYADFYSFPFLIFRESPDLYFLSAGISIAAALLGASRAIWSVIVLPAAIAMRPPAPTVFKALFSGRLSTSGTFSQLTIMAARQIIRRPIRALLTSIGVAFSVSLLVVALFSTDSVNFMVDQIFFRTTRQDATLSFDREQSITALDAVRHLPGVMRAEPFRSVPVTLRNGYREKDISITGVAKNADLSLVTGPDLSPLTPAPDGLMITDRVADQLALSMGDRAEIELLEKNHRRLDVTIAGITDSLIGIDGHMRIDALDRLVADGRRITGAHIAIDPSKLDELYDAVKNAPAVAFMMVIGLSRAAFTATIEQNMSTMRIVYTLLAVVVTFGLIYNSARIQLSERARELASLRVLGFTRGEVSWVLLTELVVVVVVAQPIGWGFGYLFALMVVKSIDSDLYRIPFVIRIETFAISSMIVFAAALVSALIVRRRIDRFDLISVLKTRE